MILGVVLVILGVLGFFNNPVLGIFSVNTLHNIVNLVVGLLAIWAASSSEGSARMFSQWFGVIFAIITILDFVAVDFMVNLVNINMADKWLHLVLAVLFLWLGFGTKKQHAASM